MELLQLSMPILTLGPPLPINVRSEQGPSRPGLTVLSPTAPQWGCRRTGGAEQLELAVTLSRVMNEAVRRTVWYFENDPGFAAVTSLVNPEAPSQFDRTVAAEQERPQRRRAPARESAEGFET